MHYGHPDVMNNSHITQQGGVPTNTKTMNFFDVVFTGADFACRGGGQYSTMSTSILSRDVTFVLIPCWGPSQRLLQELESRFVLGRCSNLVRSWDCQSSRWFMMRTLVVALRSVSSGQGRQRPCTFGCSLEIGDNDVPDHAEVLVEVLSPVL